MKESSPMQLFDDQLLSIIMTWSELYDRMESAALDLPMHAYDWEDEVGYVCPELFTVRQYDEMQVDFLSLARSLVSSAEELGLISLDEWRTINHILWYAGSDNPIEEDWE